MLASLLMLLFVRLVPRSASKFCAYSMVTSMLGLEVDVARIGDRSVRERRSRRRRSDTSVAQEVQQLLLQYLSTINTTAATLLIYINFDESRRAKGKLNPTRDKNERHVPV